MTNIELALTNLGEASAVEIHKKNRTNGMSNLKKDVNIAGNVIKKAREELEKELQTSVVTGQNYIDLTKEDKQMIENK